MPRGAGSWGNGINAMVKDIKQSKPVKEHKEKYRYIDRREMKRVYAGNKDALCLWARWNYRLGG